MFCPVCRLEYRDTYTRCAECGAALVPTVDISATISAPDLNDEPPEVLWRGQDPVAFSAILGALSASGIPFLESHRRDYTASLSQPLALGYYGLPYWQIFVHRRNLQAARQVVEAALSPQPSLAAEPDPAEAGFAADPSAIANAGPVLAPRDELPPPVEIWRGDADRAEYLRKLLLDNSIPCWESRGHSGAYHLYVRPEFQARARAVVEPALERAQSA